MILLPPNFEIRRYGLYARLVAKQDVDFILELRTNKELTKFIHQTDNDRDNQIEWINEYKVREEEGRDYYFIFFHNNKPVGLNRVYNRSALYATSGSWLCKPEIESWIPIALNFILNDIIFEILKVELVTCDVRKGNKLVNKYHVLMGDVKIHESDIDNFYYRTKQTYTPNRDRFVKLYNFK